MNCKVFFAYFFVYHHCICGEVLNCIFLSEIPIISTFFHYKSKRVSHVDLKISLCHSFQKLPRYGKSAHNNKSSVRTPMKVVCPYSLKQPIPTSLQIAAPMACVGYNGTQMDVRLPLRDYETAPP